MYILSYYLEQFSQCLYAILVWVFGYLLAYSLRQDLTMELRLSPCLNHPGARFRGTPPHLAYTTSRTFAHCTRPDCALHASERWQGTLTQHR